MPIKSNLLKRLTLPPMYVAVNFNDGSVFSFLTYSQASRGVIRLVNVHKRDPFFCLFRLRRYSGSRAKPLGRLGRHPGMDYDWNQCWGEWNTWEADEPFISKGGKKLPLTHPYQRPLVDYRPTVPYVYPTEEPEDESFTPEVPTRFMFYVDRRELMVRPVLITGRRDDLLRYDWPCMGSWGRGEVDEEQYFHGTAEWAMDQLLELMAAQGSLEPWMGDDDA